MMKRSERAIAGLISLGLLLGLSACGRAPEEAEEFVSRQAFEYHFYPEEYEEEYSSVGRTLPLEGETDYQFRIEAECASGTMEIRVTCGTEEQNRSMRSALLNPAGKRSLSSPELPGRHSLILKSSPIPKAGSGWKC